eukprot:gene14106-5096_t
MDPNQLLQDSYQFAKLATTADGEENFKVAIFYYLEAAEAIKKALDFDQNLRLGSISEKAHQYLDRAETLHQQIGEKRKDDEAYNTRSHKTCQILIFYERFSTSFVRMLTDSVYSKAFIQRDKMDPNQLLQDSYQFAKLATTADGEENFKVAIFYYLEAAEAIKKALDFDQNLRLGSISEKAHQYLDRAETLHQQIAQGQIILQRTVSQTNDQKELERAEFFLKQALEQDENGKHEEALTLYTDAVQLCLQAAQSTTDSIAKERLNKWATSALDRAEVLKGKKPRGNINQSAIEQLTQQVNRVSMRPDPSMENRPKLTQLEIETLRHSSYINKNVYPPWIDRDLLERFAFPIPFSDPDGQLALAPKQKAKFAKWVRPSDLCADPHMIYAITSLSIRQTIVSDCSFVASLAISAAYERKFRKQLITSIIYPQNKEGKPMINPCGKYMVKLIINGVPRKVIIDDFLPIGKDGELLCSYSNNSDEFWVSLLEKAYLKVMGGYDFPGSNSNIDLGALTGWIPERASLKSEEVNKERLFERMFEALHRGDVLITVATGFLSEADTERSGLVETHAYAVLDIRKIKGLRLLQLKNPWNHLRWKGKYSETDTESWNIELLRALDYDRMNALQNDNGVFWINWESVCRFFDVFYLNWNPKLFKFKYTIHSKWQAGDGPIKDSYNVGDNPQYLLTVHSGDEEGIIWILLTRHIMERDDFANNKEFITVHAYKNSGNSRVYYPGNQNQQPTLPSEDEATQRNKRFNLVVSQYEKYNTIYYTLKVFGTVRFEIGPVGNPYTSRKRVTGQWTKLTAGGCANHPSYLNNPKYDLEIISNTPCSLLIKVEASKQYATGVEISSVEGNFKQTSGDYRYFVHLALLATDLAQKALDHVSTPPHSPATCKCTIDRGP